MGSLVSKKKQSPPVQAETAPALEAAVPTVTMSESDVKGQESSPSEVKSDTSTVPEVKVDEAPPHEGSADKVDDETPVTVVQTPVGECD